MSVFKNTRIDFKCRQLKDLFQLTLFFSFFFCSLSVINKAFLTLNRCGGANHLAFILKFVCAFKIFLSDVLISEIFYPELILKAQ